MPAPKKTAKAKSKAKVTVKDLKTKKNPKGGIRWKIDPILVGPRP